MSAAADDRALRKRMLLVRAELERAELGERVVALRASTRWPSLLGGGIKATTASGVVSTALWVFRRYPVLGTGVSLVVARLAKGGVAGLARTTLKWGALGLLGWQAWRWWQRHQPPRNEQYR